MGALAIDVHGLTKRFGSKIAVNNVDIAVPEGEVWGFLGPNGSGKTTTIRMLCGLLHADEGEGTCLGYDFRTQSEQIKREVGYMTQRFSFWEDLSIRENLDFVARVYELPDPRERGDARRSNGSASTKRQDQLAGDLSGGWKQRLALAACMLHSPKLLLLDEPTAGVDPKARRDFWDEIHRLSGEGLTVLVSTHYMDEAERCDRIVYINLGNDRRARHRRRGHRAIRPVHLHRRRRGRACAGAKLQGRPASSSSPSSAPRCMSAARIARRSNRRWRRFAPARGL